MIMHIVGNRPQLIKLAPLSRELRRRGYEDIIIHTGQHYDENMSDIFFRDLVIEKPFKNLMVGSGTHAYITGKSMQELEKVMVELEPDGVIVYGDTDSSLAAALAAAKLNIPIVHVEAGPRTYVKSNPEEMNRVIVDHLSQILCCPDQVSVDNLKKENITEGVYFTGDIMFDSFLYCKEKAGDEVLDKLELYKQGYVLMTWHRQENTETKKRMENILRLVEEIKETVLCPMHPRTEKMLKKFDLWDRACEIENFSIIEPIGYMEMVSLINHSKFVLCDSGGLSKETYFAGKKCFFMLNFNPWKELVNNGNIVLIDFDDSSSHRQIAEFVEKEDFGNVTYDEMLFGTGRTAEVIVDIMKKNHLI